MVIDPEIVDALAALRAKLEQVWGPDTAFETDFDPSKPSKNQCVPATLLVQDLYGGEILRTVNCGVSHYWNRLPGGFEVDLTRDQFPVWAPTEIVVRDREYLTGSEAVVARYEALKASLAALAATV